MRDALRDHDCMLERATVPEHSPGFMEAMSGGVGFVQDGYYFLSGAGSPDGDAAGPADSAGDEPWLMAIGYPLAPSSSPTPLTPSIFSELPTAPDGGAGSAAFDRALTGALRRTGAVQCWAVGPDLPERLLPFVTERDAVYVLPADSPVPGRLRGVLDRSPLRVREGRTFTPAHRRLWAEFMGRTALKPDVRALYARTEAVLNAPGTDLRLFDALAEARGEDGQERVVACLVLDFAPRRFCSYIIGAHSRAYYAPHATDLLFRAMLRAARREGKDFVHLGLGVNDGIRRFKRKWGGRPVRPFAMAAWREERAARPDAGDDSLVRSLLTARPGDRWRFTLDRPEQRPFAMLWSLDKEGRRSWIGGTAHFFCCSFEQSLRRLFADVDTVILEGPLDQESLAEVESIGRTPPGPGESVLEHLAESDVACLESVLCARRWLADRPPPSRGQVRELLAATRPWYAFFSLWTLFLEQRGWNHSVDLEVWNLAHDMGRTVFGMENVPEQIASLESAPMDRIVRFLRDCHHWNTYRRRNAAAYLRGDLEGMLGTSTEFPSRTERIIDERDGRFRERMRPWLERGGTAAFVGSAHMLNLRRMLAEDGFAVRPAPRGWRSRLAARLRPDKEAL